jgi:CheY-like chemotaxis protein
MQVSQLVNLVANALVVEEKVAVPVERVPVAEIGPLEGFKILVTDDEPDFVTYVTAVLEDNGATVLAAYTGDEAIETARREKPDLITLDVTMPGKTGVEVFEEMRGDPALRSIAVCIITGKPELRQLIYERDVPPPEGYVDKPITEEGLLRNVRKILKVEHS